MSITKSKTRVFGIVEYWKYPAKEVERRSMLDRRVKLEDMAMGLATRKRLSFVFEKKRISDKRALKIAKLDYINIYIPACEQVGVVPKSFWAFLGTGI